MYYLLNIYIKENIINNNGIKNHFRTWISTFNHEIKLEFNSRNFTIFPSFCFTLNFINFPNFLPKTTRIDLRIFILASDFSLIRCSRITRAVHRKTKNTITVFWPERSFLVKLYYSIVHISAGSSPRHIFQQLSRRNSGGERNGISRLWARHARQEPPELLGFARVVQVE